MLLMFGAAVLVWAACSTGRASTVTAMQPESDRTVRGRLMVTGDAPDVAVVIAGSDGSFELVGSLRSELATLAGAIVRATGPAIPARRSLGPASIAIDVQHYEIDSIAGGVPAVGILAVSGGDLTVGDVTLSGAPVELRRWVGAKVWVVGPRGNRNWLIVQTFGVLRQAPRPSSERH